MNNSVEYLINEISEILRGNHLNSMQYLLLADALKKAREMHKEEIILANANGRNKLSHDYKYVSPNGTITKLGKIYGEDYYHEEFNKEQILNQSK